MQKPSKKNTKKSANSPNEVLAPGTISSNIPDTPPSKQLPGRSKSSLKHEFGTMSESSPKAHSSSQVAVSEEGQALKIGISSDWLDRELKKIEKGVSTEFQKELNVLYQNIQNDRAVQDSAAIARHEAVLRLVSSTLSTNIEKSLSRIMMTQIQQAVLPALSGVTVQVVTPQVVEAVARILHQLVPHEIKTQLPVAINAGLQNPHISRTISESVSAKITSELQSQLSDMLHKSITPSVKNLTSAAAEKSASVIETRLAAEIGRLEADRRADLAKMDKMSQVLQGMAQTMQAMSESQVAFQAQILKDRRSNAQPSGASATVTSLQVSTSRCSPPSILTSTQAPTPEDIEVEAISGLMNDGKYEEGSIKWLQSAHPVELFDRLFVRYTPEYLSTDVSPLVAFSVAITIANSLSTNAARRLEWMNAAFGAVDVRVSGDDLPVNHDG